VARKSFINSTWSYEFDIPCSRVLQPAVLLIQPIIESSSDKLNLFYLSSKWIILLVTEIHSFLLHSTIGQPALVIFWVSLGLLNHILSLNPSVTIHLLNLISLHYVLLPCFFINYDDISVWEGIQKHQIETYAQRGTRMPSPRNPATGWRHLRVNCKSWPMNR